MTDHNKRRPFRNFFIKRSLQLSLIVKFFSIILFTAVLTTLILTLYYNTKSQSGSFYFMSNDLKKDLELYSILGIVLPALIVSQAVSLILISGISLVSSRKIAVPLYKIEKWAKNIKDGKLKTHLEFRESNQMKDLTIQCNGAINRLRETLVEIKRSSEAVMREADNPEEVKRKIEQINSSLSGYEL